MGSKGIQLNALIQDALKLSTLQFISGISWTNTRFSRKLLIDYLFKRTYTEYYLKEHTLNNFSRKLFLLTNGSNGKADELQKILWR